MTQLDRIEQKIDSHIRESNEKHLELSNKITTLIANEKANYKTIQEHDGIINTLVNIKNQGKGVVWILGIGWVVMTFVIPIVLTIIFK